MKFSNYLTVTILSNPTFCGPASSLSYQDLDGGLISVWSDVCLCVFRRNTITELVSLVLGLQVYAEAIVLDGSNNSSCLCLFTSTL